MGAWPRHWGVLLCCVLLAGCAGKLPGTTPLTGDAAHEALNVWDRFLHREHPEALDADFRLRWDVLGSKGGIDAVVQMKKSAQLRFSANDPLGRALILVGSDGERFTFVDNRSGEVFQGKTSSEFWRGYVPESIKDSDLFAYLGGFVDPQHAPVTVRPALDEEGKGFWYLWRDNQSIQHSVLLDSMHGAMQRHLLVDRSGERIVDLRYSGSVGAKKNGTGGLSWPEQVTVSGKAISGELQLQVEKIYSFTVEGTAAFRLTPPPHFTVEQVE